MSILKKLEQLPGLNASEFNLSDSALQTQLAPRLRVAAIEHLRSGRGPVAQAFRGEYLSAYQKSYDAFLVAQAKNRAWATYVEAEALAELLDCHLVVTPVTKGQEGDMICLHRASEDKAPTIHLYNSDNTHWFVNSQTKGDGNCLYNAIAQVLRGMVKPAVEVNRAAFFNSNATSAEQAVVRHQHHIEQLIQKQDRPAERVRSLEQEQERISKLPVEVQEQIASDHAFALQLAAEEMRTGPGF